MKVLALLLSMLISLSSIQWEFNFHYCKGEFASFQLFSSEHEGCAMEDDHCHKPEPQKKSCCTPQTSPQEEEPCCDDQTIEVDLDQPFLLSKTELPKVELIVADQFIINQLTLSEESTTGETAIHNPPRLNLPPVYLSCCSFRFYG